MGKAFSLFVAGIAIFFLYARWNRVKAADEFQQLPGSERIARARASRDKAVRERFQLAGLPYPPREIFLRWFKKEAVVELWARAKEKPFLLVHTYPVLASSGVAGPKRREGDRQVPEGFYEIDRFNPESLYHLSLRLNYPNQSDRVLSDREKPGGDIYIHGNKVSIGCAPLGDEGIEELFLIAIDTRNRGQARIPVHIFPARMGGTEWAAFYAAETARNPALGDFWQQLQQAYDLFESRHLLPKITICPTGMYKIKAP